MDWHADLERAADTLEPEQVDWLYGEFDDRDEEIRERLGGFDWEGEMSLAMIDRTARAVLRGPEPGGWLELMPRWTGRVAHARPVARPRERRSGRRRTPSRAGPDSEDPEPAPNRRPLAQLNRRRA